MGIDELLQRQSGVVALRQALDAGLDEGDVAGRLRTRAWVTVHPGVFADRTGPLTWRQRSWAAVLLAWPAALCHRSALRVADGPGRRAGGDAVIHVAIDRDSPFMAPLGIRAHRLDGLGHRVRWDLAPPRVRAEEAVLDLAAEAEDDREALGWLVDAVRARRTTPARLLEVLDERPPFARRALLGVVLEQLRDGVSSHDVMRLVVSGPRSA